MRAILALFFILTPAWSSALPTGVYFQPSVAITNPLDSSYIPTSTPNAPAWVWTTDASSKVFQDVGGPGVVQVSTPSTGIGGFTAAQIFVQAPAGGLSNVNVSLSSLVNTRTGFVISTNTINATGNVVLYWENYVSITTMSINSNIANSGYFNSKLHFIPDALVPTVDPYYHQVTNANGGSVTAGQNQGFLIAIWVPSNADAGYYSFTVTMTSAATNSVFATIPGALEVGDFAIPATATFSIYTGYDNTAMCQQQNGAGLTGCKNYGVNTPSDAVGQILTQHDAAVLGLDFRMQVGNLEGLTTSGSSQLQTYFGHLLLGQTSASLRNTITSGAKLIAARESLQGTDNPTAANWISTFTALYPPVTTLRPFSQACDEPGSSWGPCFTTMIDLAASGITFLASANYSQMNVAAATGTLNILATLVDDMASNKANSITWAANAGKAFGSYNDCTSGPCSGRGGQAPNYPNHHIDGLPVFNSAQPWLIVADSGTFELNSDVSLCWITACGANASKNPWAVGGMLYNQSAHTTTSSDGQGDETWFWPGTTAQVNVSTPIFLPSLRVVLHAIGEIDIEEKALLKAAGQDQTFWTQLNTWYTSEGVFNIDPYNKGSYTGTITSARQNLLCAAHQIAHPGASCGW